MKAIKKEATPVSRSVYQKVVEENKRLLSDIRVLTKENSFLDPEKILIIVKWQEKFEKDIALNNLLKDCATKYFEEHPEERIIIPSIPPKIPV